MEIPKAIALGIKYYALCSTILFLNCTAVESSSDLSFSTYNTHNEREREN
jgi:hypothetical protein